MTYHLKILKLYIPNPVNIKIAKTGAFLQARQAGEIEVVSIVDDVSHYE